jgi:hypothetical protein
LNLPPKAIIGTILSPKARRQPNLAKLEEKIIEVMRIESIVHIKGMQEMSKK